MQIKSKIILVLALLVLVISAGLIWIGYQYLQASNVKIEVESSIFITTGSNLENVITTLDTSAILKNTASFRKVATWMKYKHVIPGKYTIKPGWNNRQIVGLLRSGNQTPVNLVLNNVRTIADLAGKISLQLEVDSIKLLDHFTSSTTLENYGLTPETILTLFIPNTYQVYWTEKPQAITDRLKSENEKFWQRENRQDKAEKLNLSREQVYTLASIVERETQAGSERPTVAGLYINRLQRSIPLQADPTVVFATGIYDLRRVLNKHLEIESPYNTYKYAGLPPGPIYMPSIQSLDAVLNAENHDYLYMCARPDNSGMHAFAATLSAHNQNADRYRQWLNERGIR